MSQSIGLQLLAKILQESRTTEFLSLKREHFYQDEVKAYDAIKSFLNKHGALPSIEAVKRTGIKTEAGKDPIGYYLDEYRARALFNEYEASMPKVSKMVASRKMDEAVDAITSFIENTRGIRAEADRDVTNMADIGETVLSGLHGSRFKDGMIGVPTGWGTLDRITNGFQQGDIYVVLARPKMGKSLILLHMAEAAHDGGFVPLFISMEMRREQMGRRYFAKRAHLNLPMLRAGHMSSHGEKLLERAIARTKKMKPFHFIEGQFRKSIDEIHSLVHGLRPDAVYIDGGYLVRLSQSFRQSRWEQMEEIAQGMKHLASTCHVPVIVSFQFNREVRRGSTTAGFENIQLADAIGQLASVGIGIFDDTDAESILANQRRYIEIIGGREGETGGFHINWNWERMDFTEINPPTTEGVEQ